MFSRYGIPDIVISGNRPQFYLISSMKYSECAEKLGFKLVTSSVSSPHYPQSNGKAENALKNSKEVANKVSQSRSVRIPCRFGLAYYTYRGDECQPYTKIFGTLLENIVTGNITTVEP